MINQFAKWKENEEYVNLIKLMASLSNLFSDSTIPFLHYRVTENLFARCFKAKNLSRSDIAYDAQWGSLGIGIKTFQIKNNNQSIEKIAEFNKLSSELRELKGKDLAVRVAELRNERIGVADALCNINQRLYHIVGRQEDKIVLFNTDYPIINIPNICKVKELSNSKGIIFSDGKDEYRFYYSKSVLLKRFSVPAEHLVIPIDIIQDPYSLLRKLINKEEHPLLAHNPVVGKDYIILPLYSTRTAEVPKKSGLNQWNASGRERHPNEIYIPIPAKIHQHYPEFFPERNVSFRLRLPDDSYLEAKVCQENGKALMSNPNKSLGKWLLRDIMKKPEGELITMKDLDIVGFNSVIVSKGKDNTYSINMSNLENYQDFVMDNELA